MKIKGIIDEDFVNYKKPSMVIEFPKCDFKCDKECGQIICQNRSLVFEPNIEIDKYKIYRRFFNSKITKAIIFQGLEPFDSFNDVISLINLFRLPACVGFDIVIYTGYTKEELQNKIYKDNISYLDKLKQYRNIIIKYGRYIPDQEPHYDEVLGIKLASNNQYAEKIS